MSKTPIYADGSPMQLGDEVEFRSSLLTLFRKYRGRIVYVPGVSQLNPDMETATLSWIAIDVPGKMLVRRLVDPGTGRVHQTWLLRRDASELKVPPALAEESDN